MDNKITDTDTYYMDRALKLAKKGVGRTSPNPMVGAVITRNGQVLAEGWHRGPGKPHAEADALSKLGGKADGATIYVNLEPCIHYGRTAPCSPAIVRAGIKRVVVAVRDPNPLVAGKGIKYLKEHGVETVVGVLHERATELNRAFFKYITTGLPWVTLKMAMTLDGVIGDRWGRSKYISGPQSLRWVHRMRTITDAVMVGIGTVIADDPMLTPRDVRIVRQPVRVVLDSNLRIPLDCALVRTATQAPVRIYHCRGTSEKQAELENAGCTVKKMSCRGSRLSMSDVLADLGANEIQSVLVEGGSGIAGTLVNEKLWDELAVFVAPKLAADNLAIPVISGDTPRPIGAFIDLKLKKTHRYNDDILMLYRREG